ncbi:peroxidase-related enzyme, partial [Pseudomonas syringae]
FEQLAKRNDVIAQVFAAPAMAGTTAREKAIVQFAIDLTLEPASLNAAHITSLREQGLDDAQVLDLIHAIAIFAWANRLMLNLGEPVFPEA